MFTIHLGFSGFPYGNASVQRILLTFKGLHAAGENSIIINKISHHQYSNNKKVKKFDGLIYIHTSWSSAKPASFIARNLNKISGYCGELFFLLKKRGKIKSGILYSSYFLEYIYYYILSRIYTYIRLVIKCNLFYG